MTDMRPTEMRPAWVEIDLDAMAHNIREIRRMVGPACKLFSVVKGDGYGTGVVAAAVTSARAGADALALGNPDEVPPIRDAGVTLPILLYGATLPESAPAVAALGVIPTIHDFEGLAAFAALGTPLQVYIKLDCGLGRLGFSPEQWREAFRRLARTGTLKLGGLYSHFSNPDDSGLTDVQAGRFAAACRDAEAEGHAGFERMVASSRILLSRPDLNLTAVNPGRVVYGYLEGAWRERADIRPVVASVKARIIQVKTLPPGATVYGGTAPLTETVRAAVAPIGFLDGFNHLPPCHVALLRGKRVRLMSRRGIEHTVLDVSAVPEAAVGDEVVFLGRQGGDMIDGPELAHALGLPLLELLPRLARMAPRRYLPVRT